MANKYNTNPINKDITPASGKNHWDTQVTDGMAKDMLSKDTNNEIRQHVTKGAPKDRLGGKDRAGK